MLSTSCNRGSWRTSTRRCTTIKIRRRHLAQDCVWEAETRGITKADLIEAAGGDLDAYIVAELDRAVEREVDRMAPA